MRECDNSKIHTSSNFLLSISLITMLDTLLLVPSLHCNYFISKTKSISRCSLPGTVTVKLRTCVPTVTATSYTILQPEDWGNISIRNVGSRLPDYTESQLAATSHIYTAARTCIAFSTPLCGQQTVTALRSREQARLPAPRCVGNFSPFSPQAHRLRVGSLQSETAFSVWSTVVNYTACSWHWNTLAFCPSDVFTYFVYCFLAQLVGGKLTALSEVRTL
jgi:hypothetical protein